MTSGMNSSLLLPLDMGPAAASFRWKARVPQLVWGFVLLGTLIRLIVYLQRFPLWVDECMLAENFLDRDFSGLLAPLANEQVAPVGFLWIECALVKLFGFSEWSLRLYPLVCGIASLFVFRHLASRLLAGAPLVLAVGCLAVAKGPISLSADCKPYASDLLVTTTLLALAVEWLSRPEQTRWLWALAAFVPVALLLSFPAVFVAGAVNAGLLVPVWRRRQRAVWGAFVACQVALVGAFAVVLHHSCGPAFHDLHEFMEAYWTKQSGFPPLGDPLGLVAWLAQVHLGDKIFAVPYGAENGGGAVCFLCCVIGAVVAWRRGHRPLLTMLLATFALGFVAAALHRYPYGGHQRLVQYLVPAVSLSVGMGAATGLAWIESLGGRRLLTQGLIVGLALFGAGVCGRNLQRPYSFVLDDEHRTFARNFWRDEPGTLTVCCRTDLERRLSSGARLFYYRCNQRIYSRRHQVRERIPAAAFPLLARPVRLVVYAPPLESLDLWEVAECLKLFESRFDFAGYEEFRLPLADDGFDKYGTYRVFRFEPRPIAAQRRLSARPLDQEVTTRFP